MFEQQLAEIARQQAERQAEIKQRQAETAQRFNILLEELRFMNRRNQDNQSEQ